MQALQAGYVPGAVWQAAQKEFSDDLDWFDVFRHLGHFVIDHDVGENGTLPPELAVLQNILCRGVPTLPSLYLERQLERTTGLVRISEQKSDSAYSSYFAHDSMERLLPLLERAYCVVAPNLESRPSSRFVFPQFGSSKEQIFWNGPLRNLLGAGGMQLALRQRDLSTIVEGSNKAEFRNNYVDVAVQFPGSLNRSLIRGIVFEVDGNHHTEPDVQINDQNRDDACLDAGWAKTYRHCLWAGIDAHSAVDKTLLGVETALKHPYFRRVTENIRTPLRKDELGKRARYLALFPMAVARIQRVILELVRGGILSLDADAWHLVVIDRDDLFGCGISAARDLRIWMRHLWAIYRPGERVPIIRVSEISQSGSDVQLPARIDAILDVSVELRFGVTRPDNSIMEKLKNHRTVVIRSDYYIREPDYQLAFADPLVPQIEGAALEKELIFFLRNIFRKVDFREKQTEIIMRALKGESVIALLPTGAGKSITYQLSTLLQNGMAVVVAPIKSLMKDQDDSLKAIGISASTFINSMIAPEERRRNTALLKKGCFKFVFVSPERFIIPEFRNALNDIRSEGRVQFAYAVVDEAHCVSEWGHEFRTAYLRLGANMRKYCCTRWKKLPLLALTGTASFEVLEDVKRELDLGQERDITVQPKSMQRANLHYRVVTPVHVGLSLNSEERDFRNAIGAIKQRFLPTVLGDIMHTLHDASVIEFVERKRGSGLIFCPHKTGSHGVIDVVDEVLKREYERVVATFDYYHGASGESEHRDQEETRLVQVQDKFKQDDLRILACTKAFGMGIDKGDIRFTLHFNIPQSLEAFYQEAGRAGRDGKDAQCWVMYSGAQMPGKDHSVDFDLNWSFHNNAFPGAELEEAKVIDLLEAGQSLKHVALDEITDLLANETGLDFQLELWPAPRKDRYRIYINHPDWKDAISYVDFAQNSLMVARDEVPFPDHPEISDRVLQWLIAHHEMVSNATWSDILFGTKVGISIEEFLEQAVDGQTCQVCLKFENDYIDDIALSIGLDVKEVIDAFGFTTDAGEFLKKLNKKKGGSDKVWKIPEARVTEIKAVYPKIRQREHTLRAIYRLSILGAVDDFAANYNYNTVTVTIRRLPAGSYKENLRRYIHRYASLLVDEYMAIADTCRLPTELRCCLHALIQFVYDRIAKQRVKAMEIMEQTTIRGIDDPNTFRDAVVTFFDSFYLPEIRDQLSHPTEEYIFKTCHGTAGSSSALQHLRGACERLIPENLENPVLYALRAYALALLGYKQQDVKNDLHAALSAFEKYHGWTRRDKLSFLARLREYVVEVDREKARAFDAVLIEDHVMWLRNHVALTGD